MYIYLLTNKINGKYYVGKTSHHNLDWYLSGKRCVAKNNKNNHNQPVVAAMAKYGVDNFITDILAEPTTIAELDNLERIWIILLDSRNPELGYNVLPGGDVSRLGMPLSDEHKQKIGEANRGRKPKGYTRTEEHRQQLRDRMKGNSIGKKITPELAKEWRANETPEQKAIRGKAIKAAWDRRKLLKGEDFASPR